MAIEDPMIFDKFRDFSRRPVKQTCALKANLLGDGTVLPHQQDRSRCAVSDVRPVGDIQSDFHCVAAMPGFVCKLERWPKLQFVAISGPRVDKIAAPTFRVICMSSGAWPCAWLSNLV